MKKITTVLGLILLSTSFAKADCSTYNGDYTGIINTVLCKLKGQGVYSEPSDTPQKDTYKVLPAFPEKLVCHQLSEIKNDLKVKFESLEMSRTFGEGKSTDSYNQNIYFALINGTPLTYSSSSLFYVDVTIPQQKNETFAKHLLSTTWTTKEKIHGKTEALETTLFLDYIVSEKVYTGHVQFVLNSKSTTGEDTKYSYYEVVCEKK